MRCNLSKTHQALPMALRLSSQPDSFNPFPIRKFSLLSSGFYPKPSQNPSLAIFSTSPSGLSGRARKTSQPVKASLSSVILAKIETERSVFGCVCAGTRLQRSQLRKVGGMFFSSFCSMSADVGSDLDIVRETLPWLADAGADKAPKERNKTRDNSGRRSSWEESAEKFLQKSHSTSTRVERGKNKSHSTSTWEERGRSRSHSPPTRDERGRNKGYSPSTWEERGRSNGQSTSTWEDRSRNRNRPTGRTGNRETKYLTREDEHIEGEDEVGGENEAWYKTGNGVGKFANPKRVYERRESTRWSKQEDWGRRTFKEATESSVPSMVGEGVYGVGPVLAALTAQRREFFILYVQEGLDLNRNNKKKKDKKGFEKVLALADKLGISIKEISKHDLNMVVDNRPHQGLVLDASPLEMVNVKELDPVSSEEARESPLWVALDEVTDPQNLGAIIRSSYFFGASGVVLCAKNSAPLSGVVSKASAGSLELMELRSCRNMMSFLTSSSDNGWRVLGGSISSRAVPLNEVPPGEPTILVLGSEGTGLRPLVERSCTDLVRIPGNIRVDVSGGASDREGEGSDTGEIDRVSSGEEYQSFLAVESLNVSVAAGVLINHLIGSRYNSGGIDHSSSVERTE